MVRGSFQLGWTPDGRFVVFVGSLDGVPQSSFTLYAVDPNEGEPRIVGPGIGDDRCVVGARAILGHDRILATVARGLTTRLELIDVVTSDSVVVFEYPEGDVMSATATYRSPAGPLTVAAVLAAGDQPPELYVGTAVTGAGLRRVSDHQAGLRQFKFGPQEPFSWSTRDRLDLDGIVVYPPDPTERPRPTIVLVHGGPYGRWSNAWSLAPWNWAQWLASHGYLVILPNCRGGKGHGHRFAITARGDVGGADFRDVMDAVDAAVERGLADPARLGIGGWSQGGFMTAWAVTQTRQFKAGVMGAGVSDWGMMVMESDVPWFEATLGGGRPWDGPGPHPADRRSPISFARDVQTPLLIVHGRNDARVPVGQAIGFHRALRETGVPTELVIYPREGHLIQEPNHVRDLFRRQIRWFDRWLKD